MKDSTFVEIRLARQRAAELKKEEMAAKVREERKKEKEKKRRERVESSESETENGSDKAGGRGRRGRGESRGSAGRGFSIPRGDTDWAAELEGGGGKRSAPSPLSTAPEGKTFKKSSRPQTPSGPRRPPGNL